MRCTAVVLLSFALLTGACTRAQPERPDFGASDTAVAPPASILFEGRAPVDPPSLPGAPPPSPAPRFDSVDVARALATFRSLAQGPTTDRLLLASMPRSDDEFGLHYWLVTKTDMALYHAWWNRQRVVRERGCEGHAALARAYVLYGTFVDGYVAEAYFDTAAGDTDVAAPHLGSDCRHPETFCRAYRELVRERGAETLRRVSQTCRVYPDRAR